MTRRSAIRSVPKLRFVPHQHADQAPDAPEDSFDGEHRLRRVPPHGMTAYFYCCPLVGGGENRCQNIVVTVTA